MPTLECFIYANLCICICDDEMYCISFECLITLCWHFICQIEILLGKTENFDELMAAAAEEREIADEEQQSWVGVSLASSLLF